MHKQFPLLKLILENIHTWCATQPSVCCQNCFIIHFMFSQGKLVFLSYFCEFKLFHIYNENWFFILHGYSLSVYFEFFYFHSVKTQSNNYLYVKCTSLPNVDAYITECFTEVQISRTTSERLIQKQLLSVVSWENPPVLSLVKLNNHTVS